VISLKKLLLIYKVIIYYNCVNRYVLENLKFGKIDVGRFPDAAKKYGINDSSMSRQLPTVILFKGGKEVARRPAADDRGKLIKFFFSEVECGINVLSSLTHSLTQGYYVRCMNVDRNICRPV
jgi:hypothetical protein